MNKVKRKIAVVSVGRSDFGLYKPILNKLENHKKISYKLMVTGAHYSDVWGSTIQDIKKSGFRYESGLEMLLDGDTPQCIAKSVGLGIISFTQSFVADRPDILVVLGDRIEMLSVAIAALPFNIPIVHLYGGKITEGAIDDRVRHALTKLSHLHFATCQEYADRIIQMGEEPWRVFNYGSSALDRIVKHKLSSRNIICKKYNINSKDDFLIVSFHPVTIEYTKTKKQIQALLKALKKVNKQYVFTYPNADYGNSIIIDEIKKYLLEDKKSVSIKNAGTNDFLDLMFHAKAMVGNTSCGLSEAPSFKLPVVNVGTRQAGAVRTINVIDVGYGEKALINAIKKAISSDFKKKLMDITNPFGDGKSALRIVDKIATMKLDDKLIRKKFIKLKTSST